MDWIKVLRDSNCLPSVSLHLSNCDLTQSNIDDEFKNSWPFSGVEIHHLMITCTKLNIDHLLDITSLTKQLKTLKLENIKIMKPASNLERFNNVDQVILKYLTAFEYRD